jgi:flagellar biosynthesis/type III secretory pathway protein FliH
VAHVQGGVTESVSTFLPIHQARREGRKEGKKEGKKEGTNKMKKDGGKIKNDL